MNWDDIIYLLILLFSISFGYVYNQLKTEKQIVGSAVGVALVVLVSGYHTLHPLAVTLFVVLLLKFGPKRRLHVISFLVLFGYLLFFRFSHYVGLPMVPPHTNAIQMLLTLKLVGLCYEVHDTWHKREKLKKTQEEEEKKKLRLELKYEEVDPSASQVFHYAFCYVGVLTGPYYKYRTYADMLSSSERPSQPDYLQALIKRIRFLPFYCVMFILSGYFFPLSFAESPQIFSDYSFLFRVWYMTPVFFNFRMRIYAGFVLSECVCIMAGLGAYPKAACNKPGRGPSQYQALEASSSKEEEQQLDVDFETVHNIDEWGSDFSPTVRGGMRCWNMTVQFWLASNVYKRLSLPKAAKEAITMLVSAFWHGVHSGYYLSMLTVPFILAVEDFYDRLIRRKLSEQGQRRYDWFSWFLKMQHFAYMGMAFLLLRVDTTIHYWRSIGFIYHGLIVFMHAIAQYVHVITAKVERKLERSSNTAKVGDTHVRFMRKTAEIKLEEEEREAKKKKEEEKESKKEQ